MMDMNEACHFRSIAILHGKTAGQARSAVMCDAMLPRRRVTLVSIHEHLSYGTFIELLCRRYLFWDYGK